MDSYKTMGIRSSSMDVCALVLNLSSDSTPSFRRLTIINIKFYLRHLNQTTSLILVYNPYFF